MNFWQEYFQSQIEEWKAIVFIWHVPKTKEEKYVLPFKVNNAALDKLTF